MSNNAFKYEEKPIVTSSLKDEKEDIAIIGIACRFPGAENYDKYWENLKEGKSSIEEIPIERWDWKKYRDMDQYGKKVSISKWGGFIKDYDAFDASFFEMSNREVEAMDPQQRIMLELTWSCFEDAGICPSSASGKNIGVFTAAFNFDFKEIVERDQEIIEAHHSTGTSPALIPNRISYYFNLKGPSFEIDSACSGSLIAIHNACQSIISGDCDMALAGGISILISPTRQISFSQMRMLSPSGTCKTFDKSADGYVRGEGAAVVLLKPLSKALADGDPIHGILKGSAANHGGKMHTLTYPNPDAQADVIIKAINRAGVLPESINYMEAHGTGTPKGDPIEFQGLKKAFEAFNSGDNFQQQKKNYCGLGSAKTNIGHLESAAGIAGVIKVLLSMKHKQLPGLVNFKELNPRISISDGPFYIVDHLEEWVHLKNGEKDIPLRAGVSSFGFGGANGHVILEEAPVVSNTSNNLNFYHLICISAKTNESLQQKIIDLINWLELNGQKTNLEAISSTLLLGREHFSKRIAFIEDSVTGLKEKLKAILGNIENKVYIGEGIAVDDAETFSQSFSVQRIESLERIISESKDRRELEYRKQLIILANFYVNGYDFHWKKLFPYIGTRINLPTYPFTKEYFKISSNVNESKRKMDLDLMIHPLLHKNTSTLLRQCYCSTFTGDENFLKEHIIGEVHILPQMAYLEMARAALTHAGTGLAQETDKVRFQNVVCSQQSYGGMENVELEISLSPKEEGTIYFEIYSSAEKNIEERIVYSQGIGSFIVAEKSMTLDLEAMKNEHNLDYVTADKYYNLLEAYGVQYGERFRSLQEIYVGQNSLLARLELPDCAYDCLDSFVLYPALLESVLQPVMGFLVKHENPRELIDIQHKPAMKIDEIDIITACSKKMWAKVGLSEQDNKIEIAICDDKGKVCIQVKGYSYEVLEANYDGSTEYKDELAVSSEKTESFNEETAENMMLVPVWKPVQIEFTEEDTSLGNKLVLAGGTEEIRDEFLRENSSAQVWDIQEDENSIEKIMESLKSFGDIKHIIWITPPSKLKSIVDKEIIDDQSKGILFLFKMVKALIELGYGKKELELTIVTVNSQDVLQNDRTDPTHAGIHGLVGTMAKEFLEWGVRLLDMSPELNWPINEMLRIPVDDEGNSLAYRNRSWYKRELLPQHIANVQVERRKTVYRNGGTYVVIGGAGGIGEIWSEYMIRNYKAKIIWIGRREKNQQIEDKINRLSAMGPAPYYVSADATNLESLEKAYENIKKVYPQVNGIIHSAVGSLDKSLATMDESLYRAVVEIKINASVYMAKVFEKEPLDFIVFFSSIASFQKLAGQSGYATGCNFKDAYAHRLSKEWKCKVKTINWGFWGKVGIGKVMPESSKIRLSLLGVDEIEPDKAIEAMEPIMRTSACQVMYLKTNDSSEYSKEGVKSSIQETQHKEMHEKGDVALVENLLREKSTNYIKNLVGKALKIPYQRLDSSAPLERYGIDSILTIQLTDALNKVFVNLSSTLFFECHTIDELAEHLIQNHRNTLMELFKITEGETVNTKEQQHREKIISEKQMLPLSLKQQGEQLNNTNKFQKIAISNSEEITDLKKMPIAIVGMSGRFPKANNLYEFWDNLKFGRDCITEIPQERWDLDGFYVSDVKEALEHRKSYSKWGGFIDSFAEFDPLFFNISPQEAMNMDPQERLFLQECWRTFEDAGYTKEKMKQRHKGKIGVFVGITKTGFEWYGPDLLRQGTDIHPNTSFSSVANRISYILDLHGPSMPIDTMCSSSLSAIHEACEHLRWGECELAIAGGVNVYTHPSSYIYLCEKRMLSKSGKCRSFGKGADGFVPGEGVGAILLKPLSRAIEDRDQIYGVIRSTNINHGGKTNGYTVPNVNAQRDLIRNALDKADINARMVSYIEAHGTGTDLGDPIEITGLTQAFRKDTADLGFCAIGSAKASIGHLEAAAGIAGVMKVVLQMRNQQLVPSLHSNELNPKINFKDSPFYVQHGLTEWKRPVIEHNGQIKEYPRIAGVSSFGAGGSNAHLVIEEYFHGN